MKYRKTHGYKYMISEDEKIKLPFSLGQKINLRFIALNNDILTLRVGFLSDGPSGPTIDTKDSLKGAFCHDALYLMMELGHLDKSLKPMVDNILEIICEQEGMNPVRASLWDVAVSIFGGIWMKKRDKEFNEYEV